jgi:hypothetical protein
VEDSFEYPHKSYRWNKLSLLYSYDNKLCVHFKYIMIKIKLVLQKKNIHDQIVSLEQTRMYKSTNQRLAAQCIQKTTIDMGLW